jgi:hypothetical protein
MRRALGLAVVVASAVVTTAVPAMGDAVYHSEHIALAPVGDAPLRVGFVQNIHANGPVVFANERYVLVGASPGTAYDVSLRLWVGDTTCAGDPMAVLPTASFTTNVAGNGVGRVALPPTAADGLHGATLGIVWVLSTGGAPTYVSSCIDVTLD